MNRIIEHSKNTALIYLKLIALVLMLHNSAMLFAQSGSDNPQEYFDRFFYVGSSGYILLPDSQRNSTLPLLAGSVNWGSDWNEQSAFEGEVYIYEYIEDVLKRPDPYSQEEPSVIYQHVGLRLRWINYLGPDITARLRPLFESSFKIIPYFVIGASVEPTVFVGDENYPEQFEDTYFGYSIIEGIGMLHLMRGTNFRLRYEVGLYHAYNPISHGEPISFIFTDFFSRISLEYSFFASPEQSSGNVRVYRGTDYTGDDINGLLDLEQYLDADSDNNNLIEQNTYRILISGRTQIVQGSILELQKMNRRRLDTPEYERYYTIEGLAPAVEGSYINQLNLARDRATTASVWLSNLDIEEDRILLNWRVVDNLAPEDQDTANLVIINEYVYRTPETITLRGDVYEREQARIREQQRLEREQNQTSYSVDDLIRAEVEEQDDTDDNTWILDPRSSFGGNIEGRDVALDTIIDEEILDDSTSTDSLENNNQNLLLPLEAQDDVGSAPQDIVSIVKTVEEPIDREIIVEDLIEEVPSQDISQIALRSRVLEFSESNRILTTEQEEIITDLARSFLLTNDNQDTISISYWFSPDQTLTLQNDVRMDARIIEITNILLKEKVPSFSIEVQPTQNTQIPSRLGVQPNGQISWVLIEFTRR